MSGESESLLLDETPDAVVVTTLGGRVASWSNGVNSVFGYPKTEAEGRFLRVLTALADRPEDGARVSL